MPDKIFLLNDEAMQNFIVSGMLIVKSTLSPDFHEDITEQLNVANQGQPNPRSGIVDVVPALRGVYECPSVKGALCSILGHDMRMHYYTLSHCNPPGFPGQLWHQGSAYDRPRRISRLMVFYFPCEVTHDMGPTVVVPGTQYRKISNTNLYRYGAFVNQVPVVAQAGTVLIMHYDTWHRGTFNRSNKMRYMVKTVFERTSVPKVPSWNAGDSSNSDESLTIFRKMGVPIDNETETYKHQELWIENWKWLHGEEYRLKDWFPSFLP